MAFKRAVGSHGEDRTALARSVTTTGEGSYAMHMPRSSARMSLPLVARFGPPASRFGRVICRKWLRLRAGLARGGAEYLLTSALSHLPDRLIAYKHHVLLRCDGGSACCRLPTPVLIRVATHDDVEILAGLENLTRETVERRLGRGDLCVVAFERGRAVASTWAATGTRHLVGLGRDFDIPSDAFHVYDAFTEPHARRQGLATSLYQALFAHFVATGRTTAYAAVEVLNDASLRAHAGWGFARVGRARFVSLPWLRLALCPTWPVRSRWLHLTPSWRRTSHRLA